MRAFRVEPTPDVYGQHASRSALADYLEVVALQSPSLSQNELADLLDDNGWRLRNDRFHTPSEMQDADDSSADTDDPDEDEVETNYEQTARLTFQLIEERSRILGSKYPFKIAEGRLRLKDDPNKIYLFFLAISIFHSRDLSESPPPWETFEIAVLRTLRTEPLLAASISVKRREGFAFPEALIQAAAEIRMKGRPDLIAYSEAAHDEGSDVIANYWWKDDRPGHWALVGQATCVRNSAEWKRKMQELAAAYWAKGLGAINTSAICGFLAVPYHVEPDHFHYLVDKCNGLVLDRLRLVAGRSTLQDDEVALVNSLLTDVTAFAPGRPSTTADG